MWLLLAVLVLAQAAPLGQIGEVVRLSRAEAERGPAVRVTGVVTYADAAHGQLYVQSGAHGVAVSHPGPQVALAAGDLVEVTGAVVPGDYAPRVVPAPGGVRVTGQGALPEAELLTASMLATGAHDGRLLFFQGVVRQVDYLDGQVVVVVRTGVGRVRVLSAQPSSAEAPWHLVGAWVKVRAVVGTEVDARGALSGLRAWATRLDTLEVVEKPVNALLLPRRKLRDLLRYDPGAVGFGRLRTQGVVTLVRPNGAFFIEDGEDAALVAPAEQRKVQVGEAVEVTGFPQLDGLLLEVQDALVQPGGPAQALTPAQVGTMEELFRPDLEGRAWCGWRSGCSTRGAARRPPGWRGCCSRAGACWRRGSRSRARRPRSWCSRARCSS
jgi:hypothetical protein